ncbi:putative GrpE protein like protein [Fusarium oxysporum f. sp. albedinis]|nr:putative GrpE protein like protein [Fusarium oxysporum f. sp. albedinis]
MHYVYPFPSDFNILQEPYLLAYRLSNYTKTELSATPKVPSPIRHFLELAVETWSVVILRFWGKVKRQQWAL